MSRPDRPKSPVNLAIIIYFLPLLVHNSIRFRTLGPNPQMRHTIKLVVLSFVLFSSIHLLTAQSVVLVQDVNVNERVGKSDPKLNRQRGMSMLKGIKEALEEHYYDKNYRGIDINAKFKEAGDKIKSLETNSQIFRVIAGLLLDFNDSHTLFYPPGRSYRVEYGFSMQMIGDRCFVVNVKKGSDAEKKGLKVGEQVLKIGQYDMTRESFWVLNYYLYQLEPMPVVPVTVASLEGNRSIGVQASFKSPDERRKEAEKRRKEKRENPYRCHRISSEVTACKLLTFSVEKKFIDQMMKEALAGTKLILDLRGNRGGFVKMNEYLTSHFFDREVKIADVITRRKTETRFAKPVRDRQFKGDLVVLIDSDSASASEVFSRVIQIEKRGTVVGDVSAGAVMTSYNLTMANSRGVPGYETLSLYGMNVTVADVIMSDGQRLEHIGVIPDHPVGPSSQALANKSDPVLAFAAEMLGAKITSDAAGKLNLLFSKDEDEDRETDDDTTP